MWRQPLSSAALASKGEPCVWWKGWGACVYLEIVRLGASFHCRQRVYGRFGHFDLHHLPRAQRGGIRTDMGSWREQGAPNASKHGRISGEEVAPRPQIWRERLSVSSAERKAYLTQIKVCVLWRCRSWNKPFGIEASPLEPTFRSVLSVRLWRGCQCPQNCPKKINLRTNIRSYFDSFSFESK